MKKSWLLACVAGLSLAACNSNREAPKATTQKAADAAGGEPLATGLGDDSKFAAAVKQAGLEPALAGPTPYTLLVPDDRAFAKLPGGELERLMKPEGRKELTAILTTHVLPGTMLIADIGKAIDTSGGKAQIRTLGGETLVATRNGDQIRFADTSGTVASVTGGDVERSNGVIHHVDAVLMPGK